MGFLLCFFSVCSFALALFEEGDFLEQREYTAGLSLPDEEIIEVRLFNSYIVASSFALVGAACFLCVWKKKKWLDGLQTEEAEEQQES